MTQGKRLLLIGGSRGGGKRFLTMSSQVFRQTRKELITWLMDMEEKPCKLKILSTRTLRNMVRKRTVRFVGPRLGSGSPTERLHAQEPELQDLPHLKK